MGDVLTLIEDLEAKVDKEKAAKLSKKIKKGISFDLEDFRDQLIQMKNMGGMSRMMDKLPGMGKVSETMKNQVNDKASKQMEAIINSMTKKERTKPEIIKGGRKRRIATGSGMQIQDVNAIW
jgi:signal recognition particle subunit SRP54